MSERERFAPDGMLWVCGACGKTASDRWGIKGSRSMGWDESCAINCGLYETARLIFGKNYCVVGIRPEPDREPIAEADAAERFAQNCAKQKREREGK